MDLTTYVREHIVPHLEKNDDGQFIMPGGPDGIENDIDYFSQLHSWYKHFRGCAQRVLPILRLGREPRNALCIDEDEDEKNKLHWWFIIADEDDELIKSFPLETMKKYQATDLYKFHKLALTSECQNMWNEIIKVAAK